MYYISPGKTDVYLYGSPTTSIYQPPTPTKLTDRDQRELDFLKSIGAILEGKNQGEDAQQLKSQVREAVSNQHEQQHSFWIDDCTVNGASRTVRFTATGNNVEISLNKSPHKFILENKNFGMKP